MKLTLQYRYLLSLVKEMGRVATRQTILVLLFFFSHLHVKLGVCAGFALANCNWQGRTIAFYQVFFGRVGWLWANDVSVPRKVTSGLPG